MARIKTAASGDMGHQVKGKVAILYGTVKAVSPDGTVRLLKVNSPVFADDRIITGDDGSISIVFNTFPPTQLDLGRVSDAVIDEDIYGAVSPGVTAESAAEQKAIQEALLAGDQPIELEATAAGGEANAGGGHPTFVVAPDWSVVKPESGAETAGISWATPEADQYTPNPENAIPTIIGPETGVVYEAGLNENGSNAASNTEFSSGTFTVADPDGLSNIASITINGTTIPIGDVVGTVINGTNGIMTITGYDSATGAVNYTYELKSLTTDGPGPEQETFNVFTTDGTGAASAPVDINIEIVDDLPNAVDDVRTIDEDSTAPITGNVLPNDLHPNGEPGADVPTSFVNWTTTTALYGTFTDLGNGNYSYVLDNTNPIVQALGEGETLVERFPYWMQDADNDQDNAELIIIINGSDEAAPPVIASVSLTATPVITEAETSIVYTATLNNTAAVDSPVTVTLSNGEIITIAAGANSGSVIHAVTPDEDIYIDPTSVSAIITEATGGNFSSLVIDSTPATTQIVDTINPVTVDLAVDPTTTLEGAPALLYTATLTGGTANNAITVTLANGETITIAAGSTFGTTTTAIQGDDPYLDGETINNHILSAVEANAGTPGALENLQLAADTSVSTVISDTIDTTTVTLEASVPVGGLTTITASVNNAPQTDLELHIIDDNGNAVGTITILAGQLNGTINNYPVPVGTTVFGIDNTVNPPSGGNYEYLDISDTADTYGPANILNLQIITNTNNRDQYLLVEFTQTDADGIVHNYESVLTLQAQGQQDTNAIFNLDVGVNIDAAQPYDLTVSYMGNSDHTADKIIVTDFYVEGIQVDDTHGNIVIGDKSSTDGGFDVHIEPGTTAYYLTSANYFDPIMGTEGDDTLSGISGNDVMMGGPGNDILNGLAGDDSIDGGNGNDTLSGGAGNNILHGGQGADTFVVSNDARDNILDYNLTEGDKVDVTSVLNSLEGDHSRLGFSTTADGKAVLEVYDNAAHDNMVSSVTFDNITDATDLNSLLGKVAIDHTI
ncbi:MAG: retention module-containing protein [Smithella sp.]